MMINENDIINLRRYAMDQGDTILVASCDKALAGDDAAFTACEELINDMYDQTHGYTA